MIRSQDTTTSKRITRLALAGLSWFALILQLILLKESIFNFFSYFTILSNLLIAFSLTAEIGIPRSKVGNFFSSIVVQTGITLYIFIVGLIYNLILRGIWEPKGWQLIADNLLHVVVPISYSLYWIIFISKGTLTWKNGLTWAYLPMAYLIYSLVRGHFVNWYPYPFLDVNLYGYQQVFINAGFVIIAFFFFGAVLIGADRLLSKKK